MNWRDVKKWCMGANDEFGTCAYAMVGNQRIMLGDAVMGDGEIENAARELEGFNPYIKATDKGINVEVLFNFLKDGWPGDPMLQVTSWSRVAVNSVADMGNTGAPSWLLIPMTADGTDYDFTDDALRRRAPGKYAHAVLSVELSTLGLTFITWAEPKTVSLAWAREYFQAFYSVTWNK